MSTFIEKINNAFGGQNRGTKASIDWFRKYVKNMKVNRSALLKDGQLERVQKPRPGRMYMFRYDAKHKDTLPYFDRFPLIFMVGPAKGGFYGLNLHYLPPRMRAIFFDRIMQLATSKKVNEKTRLKMTYDMLAGAQKFKAFAPCFKHYLVEQMKSEPTLVPADHWETVLFLPSAHWQGAKENAVWKQTKKLIG